MRIRNAFSPARRVFALGILLAGCTALGAATKPVNTDRHGVAVNGYDVVAYFTEMKPVKGSAEFTHE